MKLERFLKNINSLVNLKIITFDIIYNKKNNDFDIYPEEEINTDTSNTDLLKKFLKTYILDIWTDTDPEHNNEATIFIQLGYFKNYNYYYRYLHQNQYNKIN